MATDSIVRATLASLLILVSASGSYGQLQSRDQQNCLNKLNRAGANVGKQQGKENVACIKAAGKGDLMITAQACLIADLKGRMLKKTNKTTSEHTKYCGIVPNFGYTNDSTINQFSAQAQRDLLADIFGANLDAAVVPCDTDKDACTCQHKIPNAVNKVAARKLNEFLKCKKAVLKDGATSIAALEDCIDDPATESSIAADTKGMIAKAMVSLNTRITKDCDDEGVTATSFPGECFALTGTALATCLDILVECRVCQLINDIDSTFVNCDVFDDGNPNASCVSGSGPTPTITNTPTQTHTPTITNTPTETPTVDPSLIFRGALTKEDGDFNYGGSPGVAGANTECNVRYPGSHACLISELLAAEAASGLDGATDHTAVLVTSFWVIDPMRPNDQQCYDAPSMLRWDYATAHTGIGGTKIPLNNVTGDLGTPTDHSMGTIFNCNITDWVGCCQ